MSMPTEDDQKRLHRFFAIEFNNVAWVMATQQRTHVEDSRLLDVAHASKAHWDAIGTEVQMMRALLLVAHAHACCGIGKTAITWARRCTEYFAGVNTEQWEQAFVCMIHAQAAFVAGERAEHVEYYGIAKGIVDSMPDGEDKNIVLDTWRLIPGA